MIPHQHTNIHIDIEHTVDFSQRRIAGYVLWTLSGDVSGGVNIITREAALGTLEHHFISPFGFRQVLLAKAIARVLSGGPRQAD